jgi:NAD-dependent dihydropyrimidine dehydrogenase PreA subunit
MSIPDTQRTDRHFGRLRLAQCDRRGSPDLMALFVRIDLAPEVEGDKELAQKLVGVCPVDIFEVDGDGSVAIVEDNVDECVLCELCIEAAPPGGVKIAKLYSDDVLQRKA